MSVWWVNKQKNRKRLQNIDKHHVNRVRNQKFYQSAKWLRTRIQKLFLNPICENCIKQNIITPAIEIHHTLNINTNQDWINRYNIDLLQSLCKSCHTKETKREQSEIKNETLNKNMDDLSLFD